MEVNRVLGNEAVRVVALKSVAAELDYVYNSDSFSEERKEKVMTLLRNLESKVKYYTHLEPKEAENLKICMKKGLENGSFQPSEAKLARQCLQLMATHEQLVFR